MSSENPKIVEKIVPMCKICGEYHVGSCKEIKENIIKDVKSKEILKKEEKMTFPNPNWVKDDQPGE